MKCLNCGRELDKKSRHFCVYCGSSLDEQKEKMATSKKNISLDDTISQKIDEINEEIETEKKEFKIRRNNLIFFLGLTISICLIILGIFLTYGDKNEYVDKVENSLETYKIKNDNEELKILLDNIANSKKDTKKVQENVYEVLLQWINEDLLTEFNNLSSFKNKVEEEKKLITEIYDISVTKNGEEIHYLTIDNKETIEGEINKIYDDAITYYEAIDEYQEKDYNEAYELFNNIDEENRYYDKARKYMNIILETVIGLLQKDINKIEKGIDNLEKEEQQKRYKMIESVILQYPLVYSNLELEKNDEYNNLLKTIRSKIEE